MQIQVQIHKGSFIGSSSIIILFQSKASTSWKENLFHLSKKDFVRYHDDDDDDNGDSEDNDDDYNDHDDRDDHGFHDDDHGFHDDDHGFHDDDHDDNHVSCGVY